MVRTAFSFLALALVMPPPLQAQVQAPVSDAVIALRQLQTMDQRLHEIGYRLVSANQPYCRNSIPNTGLLLHDIRLYGDQAAARQAFGFSREITANAIAQGSPAAQVDMQVGDGLIAVNNYSLEQYALEDAGSDGGADPSRRLNRFKMLLEQDSITMTFARNGERFKRDVIPTQTCPGRFEVQPSKKRFASADGKIASISSTMIEYFKNDDEFAAVVAHELAHNLLDHKNRLNAQDVNRSFFGQFGKSAGRIRATEIEADRLSVWLMANAGYDPQAAVTFWTRYGKEHGKGIFSASTHLKWKKRVKIFNEEIAKMAATQAINGRYAPPLLTKQHQQAKLQ